MYQARSIVDGLENLAEKAALADREVYRSFVAEAERFAATAGLIVSGRAATRLLLGDPENPDRAPPVGLDSFQCDFYSSSAPSQAKALADAMYALDPDGLGHYALMLSKVPGQLMAIQVNGRLLFTVRSLPMYRGVRVADVISPRQRPAQFARDDRGGAVSLLCAGPDLQLIGTYAELMNPAKAPNWGRLLSEEAGLRVLFLREPAGSPEGSPPPRGARRHSRRAYAGSEGAPPSDSLADLSPPRSRAELAEPAGSPSEPPDFRALADEFSGALPATAMAARREGSPGPGQKIAKDLHRLRRDLIDLFAAGPGRVLVGSVAVALLCGGEPAGRVQVVSANDLLSEAREIAAVAARRGLTADWAVNDPMCPVDPRLRRLTVYARRADHREPVADVFNSAAVELVPYTTLASWRAARARARDAKLGSSEAGLGALPDRAPDRKPVSSPEPASLKIGTPFVVLRFRLVDSWTVQLLRRMGAITPSFARDAVDVVLREFRAVSAAYESLLASIASASDRGDDSLVELAGECLLPRAHAGGAAYVGSLDDPEQALRRSAAGKADQRARYPPYFPAASARSAAASGGAPGPASARPPTVLCCDEFAPVRGRAPAGRSAPGQELGLHSRADWETVLRGSDEL